MIKGEIKLNDIIKTRLIEALQLGTPIEDACNYAGISKPTFYSWKKQGKEGKSKILIDFFNDIKRAESEGILANLQNIYNAGANGSWQASAWILERKRPAEFGKNIAIKQEITEKQEIDYSKYTNEELLTLKELLQKGKSE